ncbi:PHP domain-containing protein, partial [Candidatus Thioglobus sp.]|nr:PHP domain-containing protein [Candidatus Thioglobus sp.]
ADTSDLKLIHGVEISAMWSNMTIHILGLGVDINNEILQKGLKQHQEFRQLRAEKMARGLGGAGVFNALEKVKLVAKTDMITRTHFAQMLVQEGVCKDMKSVFKRFLTGKKPGGVGGKWAEYDEVINWIHAAGGKAVLAHPLRYRMTNTKVRQLLNHLSGADLDGVEVVTGSSSADEITLVSQWAKEFDLLSSIGSDYHGWPGQRVRIGHLQDMPQVNEMVWKDSSWLN